MPRGYHSFLGSSKINVAPCALPSLWAVRLPPWASVIIREIKRPIPVPPTEYCVGMAVNDSKMRMRSSGAIPAPLSATCMRTIWGKTSNVTKIFRWSWDVFLIAFSKRLPMICNRRSGSPLTSTGCPSGQLHTSNCGPREV